MFICNSCLARDFENAPSLIRSYGPCEICCIKNDNNDIPSKHLIKKESQMGDELNKYDEKVKEIEQLEAQLHEADNLYSKIDSALSATQNEVFELMSERDRLNKKIERCEKIIDRLIDQD